METATDFGNAAAGNVVSDVLQPFLLVQEASLIVSCEFLALGQIQVQ